MEQEIRLAQKGDIVEVNFTCKLSDGSVFDSSEGKEPLEFIIGEGEVFSALEEAVIGMAKNESKTIHLEGEKFFGPYAEEKKQVVSRDQFPDSLKPEVGTQFHIQQEDGKSTVLTITDVDESSVTLAPNHPMAGEKLCFEFQVMEFSQSDKAKADECYKKGILAQDKGLYDEAISSYKQAVRLNPNHAEAFYNLGVAFQEKGFTDQAIIYYEIAIGLNQNFAAANYNLGVAFKEKGQTDDAVQCFHRVLQLNPDHAGAYYNFGGILVSKGKYEEALQCYQKALELQPDYPGAQWNIALIDLLHGRFEEGWKGYEARWQLKGVAIERNFSQPRWDGSDIKGGTILLYAEQGFGDTIQFIRYVPMVAERGAKVIIECQKELKSLLQNMDGVEHIVAYGEPLPAFDLQCPLLSLPLIFNTTSENIPAQIPYIKVNTDSLQKWKDRIRNDKSKLKIGIIWAGDPSLKDDINGSCSLGTFSHFLISGDILFYSLQKGPAAEESKNPPDSMTFYDHTEELYDFEDTAALISNLDLIISVDTAVAHLAGALGKQVWTLLPFVPDWRWMLYRENSPWYPTMRLFRQQSPGEWESVLQLIKDALEQLVSEAP